MPIEHIIKKDFPEKLSSIEDSPDRLYYIGDKNLLFQPSIAIVGSRRPSSYGVKAAFTFTRTLSKSGLVTVSGLAKGIDAIAHSTTIKNEGKTIAVLGHGLDMLYPSSNYSLAREILDKGGCLVSEYPPGVPPLKHHFPERNRLISGLSLGTLVIEAGEKSGSLITARKTLEQGRELFVLASAFDDTRFKGSHYLLKNGAKLVTTLQDIDEELPPVFPLQQQPPCSYTDIYTLNELIEKSNQTYAEVLHWLRKGIENKEIDEIYPQHFIALQTKNS